MQHKAEQKVKSSQYCSLKEYVSIKQPSKKTVKSTLNKSNPKNRSTKNNNHSQSKLKPHKSSKNNENFNSINVPVENGHKNKNCPPQLQNLKRQIRREEKSTRNSTDRLVKSKSAVRLQPKSSRMSPSPICHKEQHLQDKPKTQRNAPSRLEKQKKGLHRQKEERPVMKKSGSVATIYLKKDRTDRTHYNRVSIKTEGSSKMNSVIKQEDKNKKSKKKIKPVHQKKDPYFNKSTHTNVTLAKKQKRSKLQAKIQKSILYSQVSFQEFCQENPCESALIKSDKLYVPTQGAKIKTEGYQGSISGPKIVQRTLQNETQAAIKIQKVFRGYITRKYISQAKFIIGKVKIIQSWWRGILSRQKHKKGKHLSIQSSLITIKDFNQTMKTQKLRNCSESKQNTLSNNKLNIKQLIKNILEEEEQSSQSIAVDKINLKQEMGSPISKVLTKEVYVEDKIKGQIQSQRIFNSPKCLGSPNIAKTPTNVTFTVKDFFNNSNDKQKIKEIMHSPRIKSPQPPKATPQSHGGKQTQDFQIYQAVQEKIAPFQTQFSAIEEFCLLLVNFFRDRANDMELFLRKMQEIKWYRTNLTLKNWNSYRLVDEPLFGDDDTLPLDYEYLQQYQKPVIFSAQLREEILHFPEIEIELNGKHFDLDGDKNKLIHRSFLQFVFDVMEEAFYEPYKFSILEWKTSLSFLQFRDTQSLFENVFATALGHIFNWGEVMCGIILDVPEEEEQQREARQKIMQRRIEHWDLGMSSRLGIKIQISEGVIEELIEELTLQMMSLLF